MTAAYVLMFLSLMPLWGEEIRIVGFRRDAQAPDVSVRDFIGRPCALLRMETPLKGWSFEAGLDGIVLVEAGKDRVDVYVPASATSLTVSREGMAPLRGWTIPGQLLEGATYTMTLETHRPQPVRKAAPLPEPKPKQPVPVRVKPLPSTSTGFLPFRSGPDISGKEFCHHFADAYAGFVNEGDYSEEVFIGLRYTWLQERFGPYAAAAVSTDGSGAFFAGCAYRVTDPAVHTLDFQLYGGLGLVYGGCLSGEAGVRFAWRSDSRVSRFDFGFGCQFWKGGIAPTVEVGLYIWGIPVLCTLGLALGGI